MVEKIIPHLSINLGFLTQNEICLADVFILGQVLILGQVCLADVFILGQVSPPDISFVFFLTQLFISKRGIP